MRFDEANSLVVCFTHHRWFHEEPALSTEWMKKRLGVGYDRLTVRAQGYCKRDDTMAYLFVKAKYDEWKADRINE